MSVTRSLRKKYCFLLGRSVEWNCLKASRACNTNKQKINVCVFVCVCVFVVVCVWERESITCLIQNITPDCNGHLRTFLSISPRMKFLCKVLTINYNWNLHVYMKNFTSQRINPFMVIAVVLFFRAKCHSFVKNDVLSLVLFTSFNNSPTKTLVPVII